MKLTFPHMGNTYIVAKALLDDLGADYVIPPFNNKDALEIGTKLSPELACLPLKINLGNFVQAYRQGADTIFITGGCGPCRFGYYCEMERQILKDFGYEMDLLVLEWPEKGLGELLRSIRKLAGNMNIPRILKAASNATKLAVQVDELEKLSFRVRPRELEKGETDRIYRQFRTEALKCKGSGELMQLAGEASGKLARVKVDNGLNPLKIGIVGEIYTTIDSYTNFNIEAKLGAMGIEVDRSITIGNWIVDHIVKPALHLPRDMRFAQEAKPYLGAMIGGHARETVGNTILYAKNGYDGVIQIYPLTCMPEIVAESILPAIERDFDIPVLTLIIDEMTGEAGYMTRIEAFTDLLLRRRERGIVGEEFVLPGN